MHESRRALDHMTRMLATSPDFLDPADGEAAPLPRRAAVDCPDAWRSDTPAATYARSIENYVGEIRLPVGVAGPVRVSGTHARGDYAVPLVTTEAALVASHDRGMRLINAGGGARAAVLAEGVTRAPGLSFESMADAGRFLGWLLPRTDELKRAAEATTRHGRLTEVRVHVEANHVYVLMHYTTGDAAGQNMTTFATQAALDWILAGTPVTPTGAYVEANFSGDKKASLLSMLSVRGRKVSAECVVPGRWLRKMTRCSAEDMRRYWDLGAGGAAASGTVGVQGQYANGLAALYLATGQDVACVAESAVGRTRMECRGDDLYACVTLPNLIVGTVGGGTSLPSAAAGLGLLGVKSANELAEVAAAVALAGELSIVGALASGEFAAAHRDRARA